MRALLLGLSSALVAVTTFAACGSDDAPAESVPAGSPGTSGATPKKDDAGPSGTSESLSTGAGDSGGALGDAEVADTYVPPLPPAVSTTTESIMVNGEARTYVLSTPAALDPNKTYPLVMAFHGNPSSAAEMNQEQPFDTVSKSDAIVVYPQAIGASGERPGFFDWNLTSATLAANRDVQLVKAIPAALQAKGLRIDTSRVYGYGLSGGAFFLQVYQCLGNDVFRAITDVAGGAPSEIAGIPKRSNECPICPGPPTPTLLIHGQNDDVVKPESGTFEARCQAANTPGCSAEADTATTPSPCKLYSGCAKPLAFCFVPGVAHFPPWSESMPAAWAFFQAH